MFGRRRRRNANLAFMQRHLLECANIIDALRLENEQIMYRGNRLIEALEKNDGTIDAAWKIGDAVSAWMEYAERQNVS